MRSEKLNYLLAGSTGILLLIAFYFIPFFVFFAFVPLIFACDKKSIKESFLPAASLWQAGVIGFIPGFIFGAGLLFWVVNLNAPYRLWLYLGLFLLYVYFGIVFSMFSMGVRFFPFLAPFIWTSIEFLRSLTPDVGFPWGSIPYSITSYTPLIQFAHITGIPGVSFFIMVINTLIFYSVHSYWFKVRRQKIIRSFRIAAPLVSCVVMFGINYIYGNKIINHQPSTINHQPVIGIVQPNFTPEMQLNREIEDKLAILDSLSRELINQTPCDIIIWPEGAVPGYIGVNKRLEKGIIEVVDSLKTSVIMGECRVEKGKVYNSAFLVEPGQGIKGIYDKMYLVPFGERLPFDDILPFLKNAQFGQGDYSKGKDYTIFESDSGVKFACLICFESIFPRLARRFVRKNAEMLVNITDDSWFGRSPGPYQHANMAIMRAIEYRIPIARCGNTGISFFVTPYGKVIKETEIFTRDIIVHELALRKGMTFYARYGDLFAWIVVILTVGLMVWLHHFPAPYSNIKS